MMPHPHRLSTHHPILWPVLYDREMATPWETIILSPACGLVPHQSMNTPTIRDMKLILQAMEQPKKNNPGQKSCI